MLNDLISVTHFYFLLYWGTVGIDKSLGNNVKVQCVCKGLNLKANLNPKPKPKT